MRDIYRQMIKKEVAYNLSTGTTVTYPQDHFLGVDTAG